MSKEVWTSVVCHVVHEKLTIFNPPQTCLYLQQRDQIAIVLRKGMDQMTHSPPPLFFFFQQMTLEWNCTLPPSSLTAMDGCNMWIVCLTKVCPNCVRNLGACMHSIVYAHALIKHWTSVWIFGRTGMISFLYHTEKEKIEEKSIAASLGSFIMINEQSGAWQLKPIFWQCKRQVFAI